MEILIKKEYLYVSGKGTDAASVGPWAQGVGINLAHDFGKGTQAFGMPLLGFPVTSAVGGAHLPDALPGRQYLEVEQGGGIKVACHLPQLLFI